MHGAGATLADAAAKLGTVEFEGVTQHPQKWCVGVVVYMNGLIVDGKGDQLTLLWLA